MCTGVIMWCWHLYAVCTGTVKQWLHWWAVAEPIVAPPLIVVLARLVPHAPLSVHCSSLCRHSSLVHLLIFAARFPFCAEAHCCTHLFSGTHRCPGVQCCVSVPRPNCVSLCTRAHHQLMYQISLLRGASLPRRPLLPSWASPGHALASVVARLRCPW